MTLRLAVIIGSTRDGRFGPTVAHWFAARAGKRAGLDVDLIDLAEAHLPEILTDFDEPVPAPVAALAPRLAAADAFAVVTPEYNSSFPASLKTAIDWYYEEWHAKPVGVVSYGRATGGLYATAQLRQVFTELHAVAIRNTVTPALLLGTVRRRRQLAPVDLRLRRPGQDHARPAHLVGLRATGCAHQKPVPALTDRFER
jgi:NAD(P)H-dependent FMN reductase